MECYFVYPEVYLVPVIQGCDHEYLPEGNSGILLSVICEGKEIREKMSVQIKPKWSLSSKK